MKNKRTNPAMSNDTLLEAMRNLQYLEDDDLKTLIQMATKEKSERDKKAMKRKAKAKAKAIGTLIKN